MKSSTTEAKNSRLVTLVGVLTLASGALALLPSIDLLLVAGLEIWNRRIPGMVGDFLICAVAIACGVMTLKKNVIFGVIGAAALFGDFLYATILDVFMMANLLGISPSNATPDIISYIIAPLILAISIVSLISLVKCARVECV